MVADKAPLMGNVYEGALVTIIPIAANTFDERFLRRSHETVVEIPFRSTVQPEIHGTLTLRHVPRALDTDGRDILSGVQDLEIENSTWNQRGWTYQEEVISTRRLFFGHSTVFFCCFEWTRSENDPRRYSFYASSFQKHSVLSHTATILEAWGTMVMRYTSRRLTYPRDKLPAISALVRRVSEVTKDEYIVGIWRSNLLRFLLWKTRP
ncbi:hypothetical protein DL98DRAFT_591650 [Cadophora sp. DSE1049]|nr:hypothetical protein DL98DRAFT_591650 [Cadophora sp. DSE1049]